MFLLLPKEFPHVDNKVVILLSAHKDAAFLYSVVLDGVNTSVCSKLACEKISLNQSTVYYPSLQALNPILPPSIQAQVSMLYQTFHPCKLKGENQGVNKLPTVATLFVLWGSLQMHKTYKSHYCDKLNALYTEALLIVFCSDFFFCGWGVGDFFC